MYARMRPLVRGAAGVAVLSALSALVPAPRTPAARPRPPSENMPALRSFCPPGALPEGPVCLRMPSEIPSRTRGSEGLPPAAGPARPPSDTEAIPRRPERPFDASAYSYPVSRLEKTPTISGDVAAELRLSVRPGEKIIVLRLENQVGEATVTFVDAMRGAEGLRVATAHVVRESPQTTAAKPATAGERLSTYLLVYGGLVRIEPGVGVGAVLSPGLTVGYAPALPAGASTDGPIEIVLGARLVHDEVSADILLGKNPADMATSLPIDLRDVLPLRPP